MSTEPTYEYRVVNAAGEPCPERPQHHIAADAVRAAYEAHYRAEYRIQRRLVTPWQDVPEGATDDQ